MLKCRTAASPQFVVEVFSQLLASTERHDEAGDQAHQNPDEEQERQKWAPGSIDVAARYHPHNGDDQQSVTRRSDQPRRRSRKVIVTR